MLKDLLGLTSSKLIKKLCPKCKQALASEYSYCLNCGVNFKNPKFAALLSFLICGLGQIYNREYLKGIIFFFGFFLSIFYILHKFMAQSLSFKEKLDLILLFLLMLIIWNISIKDAYNKAKITTLQHIETINIDKRIFRFKIYLVLFTILIIPYLFYFPISEHLEYVNRRDLSFILIVFIDFVYTISTLTITITLIRYNYILLKMVGENGAIIYIYIYIYIYIWRLC